jgi:GTP-binding protein
VTPLDEEIARWLRSETTPVILAANKAEGRAGESGLLEAYSLGFGEPVPISAEHGEGVVDLFEHLQPFVEKDEELDEETAGEDAPLKLAIVGRPNAGKSTLINRILEQERLITGPEAGITRDSIAIDWEWQGRPVRLIDTAGMRKKAKVQDKLEKLSVADARRAVDFAEVVVLLLDATLGLEAQDLRIADNVLQEGRALVIAINKWDVAEDHSQLFQGIRAALGEGLSQAPGVPLLAVSAITGKGLDQLLAAAFEVREVWSRRVSTGQLNRWFEEAIERNPPPAPGGKRIKLRYITQVNTRPPSFVVFGTRLEMLPESYKRYLVNGLRRELGFGAVPIRLATRGGRNPFDK